MKIPARLNPLKLNFTFVNSNWPSMCPTLCELCTANKTAGYNFIPAPAVRLEAGSSKSEYFHIFTARKRSLGQAMFLHLRVILFTGGGGVGFRPCITCYVTRGSTSGGGSASGGGGFSAPLLEIHGLLWDTVNKWMVPILLECFLVINAAITLTPIYYYFPTCEIIFKCF